MAVDLHLMVKDTANHAICVNHEGDALGQCDQRPFDAEQRGDMRIAIIVIASYLLILAVIISLALRWRKRQRFGAIDKLTGILKGQPKTLRAGTPARDVPGLAWEHEGAPFEAFMQTIGKYDYMVFR